MELVGAQRASPPVVVVLRFCNGAASSKESPETCLIAPTRFTDAAAEERRIIDFQRSSPVILVLVGFAGVLHRDRRAGEVETGSFVATVSSFFQVSRALVLLPPPICEVAVEQRMRRSPLSGRTLRWLRYSASRVKMSDGQGRHRAVS